MCTAPIMNQDILNPVNVLRGGFLRLVFWLTDWINFSSIIIIICEHFLGFQYSSCEIKVSDVCKPLHPKCHSNTQISRSLLWPAILGFLIGGFMWCAFCTFVLFPCANKSLYPVCLLRYSHTNILFSQYWHLDELDFLSIKSGLAQKSPWLQTHRYTKN